VARFPDRATNTGHWTTGYCGDVPCFEYCRKRFGEQWSSLTASRQTPIGLLLLHREFQRDRPEYGKPGSWINQGLSYVEKLGSKSVPRRQLWPVVQGYGVSKAVESSARQTAERSGVGAVWFASTRIDQSYEPRIVKRPKTMGP
jgi:hypothetical protein